MALAWTGCHKDKEMNAKDPVVSNVEVSVSETQARFSWQVDFAGEFQTGVEVSQDENMSDLKRVEASKLDERFVAEVDSLSEGMKYYYRIVVWNRFNTIGQEVEEFKTLEAIQDTTYYIIAVSCLPEEGGLANGGGTFAEYDTCTLTAMPNEGYYFINWTLDDSIVSTDETYSFEVTKAANYVANFELNDNDPLTYSINSDGVSVTVTGHVDGTDASGTLTIPETKIIGGTTYTVTTIRSYAFYNYKNLTGSLTIPNSITSIGDYAFYGCYGFTGSLTISNSVTTIGNSAFSGCSGFTGSLNLPNSVSSIGDYAFSGCNGFTGSLNLSNSLTSIGKGVFRYCKGFSGSLTIPDSVTEIDDNAFYDCSGFTGNLNIGNVVTRIGSGAFNECSGFTGDLNIPNSVTTIENGAFRYCTGFNGSLNIGNSVEKIGGAFKSGAFQDCSGFIGSLNIPNSVTEIGSDAFRNCSGFTGDLTIPDSVTKIGFSVFLGCRGFTGSLTISNLVTTIEYEAFRYCNGFKGSLNIGNSVTLIEDKALESCDGFTSIQTFAENAPTLGDYNFMGIDHAIPVTVPCGSLSSYQNATGWNEFTDIQEMCQYEISATVNPAGSGTVTGSGTYNQGQTCTLSATNNPGFTFDHWTRNGTTIIGGATISFTVTTNATYVAYFTAQSQAPEGAINGKFTINASGDKVYFSQGNLQYIGSTQTWKFADHQWDYLGDNGQGNTSQTADRDLFGWGTSGYNHGANCYLPWSTSQTYSDYYAYGQSTYNLYDQDGRADWGYNVISNGGSQENSGWRVLTGGNNGEWRYVFETRSTNSGIHYAKAQIIGVNGGSINGVLLLPDDWNTSYYTLNNPDQAGANFSSNVITVNDWNNALESHGAVFLPAAGYRDGTSVGNVGSYGYYWSASCCHSDSAYYVDFNYGYLYTDENIYRCNGFSVRLVRSAE